MALPLAYLLGFVGMILGSLVVPSINQNEFVPLFIRVLLIGAGTTAGTAAVWIAFLIDWQKRSLMIAVMLTAGVGSALAAFYWSDAFTGNSDLYIRVREITQSTIVGAVIGTNVLALAIGIVAPRAWRS